MPETDQPIIQWQWRSSKSDGGLQSMHQRNTPQAPTRLESASWDSLQTGDGEGPDLVLDSIAQKATHRGTHLG